ncbi:MAG: 50S ribosomal protein L5 [Candidatus Altiarchaeota archaeon]
MEAPMEKFEYKNVMQIPRIEKVVVNIGAGESGEKLVRAEKLLEKLTKRKPSRTIAKHKIPAWNIKKREQIGCKVTLRGKIAEEFLRRAFIARDNKILKKNFDDKGNFSFGIKEYIDFPDIKYDPEIGIFGMDICVHLERPGFNIKRKKFRGRGARIPNRVRITREEAINFIEKKFGVKIE